MPNENDDLKPEGSKTPVTPGQGGEGGEGGQGANGGNPPQEETPEQLKARLAKAEEERDNYKQGLIAEREKNKGKTSTPPANGEGAGTSGGTAQPNKDGDVLEKVDARLNEFTRDQKLSMQNEAESKVRAKYPSYQDDSLWQRALSSLRLSGREATPKDFEEALEDMILVDARRNGELDKRLEEQRQRAAEQGKASARQEQVMSNGHVGDARTSTETPTLTPQGEDMARKFKHDPKKVAAVPVQRKTTIDKP